jgi:hypothetical protein
LSEPSMTIALSLRSGWVGGPVAWAWVQAGRNEGHPWLEAQRTLRLHHSP